MIAALLMTRRPTRFVASAERVTMLRFLMSSSFLVLKAPLCLLLLLLLPLFLFMSFLFAYILSFHLLWPLPFRLLCFALLCFAFLPLLCLAFLCFALFCLLSRPLPFPFLEETGPADGGPQQAHSSLSFVSLLILCPSFAWLSFPTPSLSLSYPFPGKDAGPSDGAQRWGPATGPAHVTFTIL